LCVPSDALSSRHPDQKSPGKGSGGRAAAKKVVIIGSGNFASALAPIVGKNCERLDEMQTTVNMWVYEEEFEGQKLSEVINTEHENKKYLPGIKLPDNIVAVTNVTEAVKDANVLIFCVPHQVQCQPPIPKS
jgi:glycerol-3-phosphate dehydrogenase (NAD+)